MMLRQMRSLTAAQGNRVLVGQSPGRPSNADGPRGVLLSSVAGNSNMKDYCSA